MPEQQKESKEIGPFITTPELAALLHLCPGTIVLWRRTHQGPPPIYLGNGRRKKVVYDRETALVWARSRQRAASTGTTTAAGATL